jgi:hypothetical protein
MIVDRYLVHSEVDVHVNQNAGPDVRIAAFAELRPVLGFERLINGMPSLLSPYGLG